MTERFGGRERERLCMWKSGVDLGVRECIEGKPTTRFTLA